MTELEPRAGDELERRLDRFARLRLDPSPGQAKRARSTVMEAAWRQKIEAPAAAATDVLEPSVTAASLTVLPTPNRAAAPGSRGLFGGWGARRLGVSFAAAVLAGLTIGSSVFAASRAGGPLYEARLGIEELTLPVDAQARVEAELALAQSRLAEIVDGVRKDDQRAVTASIAAYVAALNDLGDSKGGPADRALEAIQQHRAVLERVLGEVPDQARSALENALAMSSKVIERLDAVATPGATGAGPNGASGGGAAGGNNPNAGGGANNGGSGSNPNTGAGANAGGGKPDPTAKPDPTVKPSRTPKPARTPAPEPVATANPGPKTPQGGKP